MSNLTANELRDATARLEKELLARLGLGMGASNEQIEHAHEEIAQYLDKAPAALRSWAARQAAGIDEAYALLSGERAELMSAAEKLIASAAGSAGPVAAGAGRTGDDAQPADSTASPKRAVPIANVLASEATPGVLAKSGASAKAGVVLPSGGRHAMDALDDAEDWYDPADLEAAPTRPGASPPRRPKPRAASAAAVPTAPQTGSSRAINPTLRRAGLAVAAVVAVVAVGFAGYRLGAPAATPTPSAGSGDAAFQAQVASLMQKLQTNPNDLPTLISLGTLYYEASDFQTAVTWMKKALAIEPGNIDALLAYGAASYNLADYATAEDSWKKVLAADAKNLEAYYDLGFLYFSDNPPNVAKVREMWGKVIELAPDSQVAKTVASHLQSLDTRASGAPTSSGSPAPSGVAPSSAPASAAPSPN